MKIISIYNSSISKKILSKIIDIDNKDLDNILDELIRMGLLNEKVADWGGYSYSISNMQLKKNLSIIKFLKRKGFSFIGI